MVDWNVEEVGGWRVIGHDPSWGDMTVTFPPDQEEVAKWVADNHNTTATWVEPTSETVSQ
jgi:hypothetical protein